MVRITTKLLSLVTALAFTVASFANPTFFGENFIIVVSGCTTITDSNAGTGSVQNVFDSSTHVWIATKFTATTSGTFCKVDVELKKNNAPDGTLRAHIYTDGGSGPGTEMSGSPGASPVTIPCSSLTSSFVYYNCSGFSVTVSAGTSYYLVLEHNTGTTSGVNFAIWNGGTGGNTYCSATGSGAWTSLGTQKLNFKLYQ